MTPRPAIIDRFAGYRVSVGVALVSERVHDNKLKDRNPNAPDNANGAPFQPACVFWTFEFRISVLPLVVAEAALGQGLDIIPSQNLSDSRPGTCYSGYVPHFFREPLDRLWYRADSAGRSRKKHENSLHRHSALHIRLFADGSSPAHRHFPSTTRCPNHFGEPCSCPCVLSDPTASPCVRGRERFPRRP